MVGEYNEVDSIAYLWIGQVCQILRRKKDISRSQLTSVGELFFQPWDSRRSARIKAHKHIIYLPIR